MDDQTRGETTGSGSGLDVPLKRDRKRLRSSEPLSGRKAAPAEPSAPPHRVPAEVAHKPELTPVEELFASQWTASLPAQTMPASTIPPEPMGMPPMATPPQTATTDAPHHYGLDTAGAEGGPPPDETRPARRFLGLNLSRKSAPPAELTPAELAAADLAPAELAAESATGRPDWEPPKPYVPPGGFSGPGHPRLGPLAPMPLERHSGLAGLDVAAMVTAIILPPIGLATAMVALIRGRQLRGWASDLARAAVSVSLVMTVVFAGVGAYVWATETEKAEQLAALKADQRAHALVETASEPFCGVLAAHPTIYSTADPDYGWPALDAPEGYNAAIANYSVVWAELAAVAPEGIAAEAAAISERVAGVVNIANALGATNRAGDLLGLHAQTDLATVESWYVEYCDVPEIPAE